MTLKVRRIISIIFILLFLTIAPAIVLYAAGFKLSKNGFFIQKTGMFILDSNPRGAKIFIDGKIQKDLLNSLFNKNNFIVTPAKITNLLPGEYNLALELNGYSGWQKKLTINPGSSTFAEDIYLFKNDLPTQVFPAKIEAIDFSPNNNLAIILSADQITFFNLANKTKEFVSRGNLKGENFIWPGDGNKVVIDNYFFNLNDLNVKIDLSKSNDFFNYKWQDNSLYFQDKTSIYRLNYKNIPEQIIANLQFADYLIGTDYLYLIRQTEQTTDLEIVDLMSEKIVKKINLPFSTNYSFINSDHALLNLYDNNHKILYLIDPLAAYYSPIIESLNNVKITRWINNNLLYANDFEVWLYDLETKKKTLITRISETINQVIMHPSKNYILYSTGQTINAIELDEREKRNIAELVKFDTINSFILNSKGNLLYFSGKIGKTEGLYEFLIQ